MVFNNRMISVATTATGILGVQAIQLQGDKHYQELDAPAENKGMSSGAKVAIGVAGVAAVATGVALGVVLTADSSSNDGCNYAGTLPEGYTDRDVCCLGGGPAGEFNFLAPETELEDTNCKLVQGNLVITRGGEVDILDWMPRLEVINGDLLVEDNDRITKLTIIAAPEQFGKNDGDIPVDVKGRVLVRDNSNLEEVNLDQVWTVGGLLVWRNDVLDTLLVDNLFSIGPVEFSDPCFAYPCNIAEDVDELKALEVRSNPMLTTLSMPELYVSNGISVVGNVFLSQVYLPKINEISFDFMFTENRALETVTAPVLVYVGRNFFFERCDLSNFDVNSIARVKGDYKFLRNIGLTELDYFGANTYFVEVGGNMEIAGNLALTTVNIPQFDFAIGDESEISIQNNDVLESLSIQGLKDVNNQVTISSNPALFRVNMDSMESLSGDLNILANPALNILSFDQLSTISGTVFLMNSGNVFYLDQWVPFPRLTTVGGLLALSDMAGTDTFWFPNLMEIGALSVDSNPILESLLFPELLTVTGGDLSPSLAKFNVVSNPQLTNLDLAKLEFANIDTVIELADNNDDCSCACPEELGDTCSFKTPDETPSPTISALPIQQ